METGEVIYEKVYMSPRLPPKIFLKHDWKKELGSEVAGQPEGEVARRAKSSQPSQQNPNPDHDRTGKPVVCRQRGASRSQEIETRSSREEAVNHDRTGRPVVCPQRGALRSQENQTCFSRDSTNFNLEETNHDRTERLVVCSQSVRSMLNEVDIDFRKPGLPHSVVKQAEDYRVRELVKQIENHPHRQSLQRDLQQCLQPISEKSKKMIKDMGNVELFELVETDPKNAMQRVLILLESRHRLLHLRASLERK